MRTGFLVAFISMFVSLSGLEAVAQDAPTPDTLYVWLRKPFFIIDKDHVEFAVANRYDELNFSGYVIRRNGREVLRKMTDEPTLFGTGDYAVQADIGRVKFTPGRYSLEVIVSDYMPATQTWKDISLRTSFEMVSRLEDAVELTLDRPFYQIGEQMTYTLRYKLGGIAPFATIDYTVTSDGDETYDEGELIDEDLILEGRKRLTWDVRDVPSGGYTFDLFLNPPSEDAWASGISYRLSAKFFVVPASNGSLVINVDSPGGYDPGSPVRLFVINRGRRPVYYNPSRPWVIERKSQNGSRWEEIARDEARYTRPMLISGNGGRMLWTWDTRRFRAGDYRVRIGLYKGPTVGSESVYKRIPFGILGH